MEELKRNQEKRSSSVVPGSSPDKPLSKPKPTTSPLGSKPSISSDAGIKDLLDSDLGQQEQKIPSSKLVSEQPSNTTYGNAAVSSKQRPSVKNPSDNRSSPATPTTGGMKQTSVGTPEGMLSPGTQLTSSSKPSRIATGALKSNGKPPGTEVNKDLGTTTNSVKASARNESSGLINNDMVLNEVQFLRDRVAQLEATVKNLQEGLQKLTKVIEEERRMWASKEANRNEMTLIHI